MKYFLIALTFLATTGFAQTNHMIEMSTNSTALGAFIFSDSGSSSSSSQFVRGNYAYKISERVQLGVQASYSHSHNDFQSTEGYNFLVGAIYNFNDDLTNAFYTSLYAGMGWSNIYGNGNSRNETENGKIAIGKRFALTNLNLPNVTYSPEISYTRTENTKFSGFYSNTVTISFLQFSAFF